MEAVDRRITLSPSDLNDYLECPHLTALALGVEAWPSSRTSSSPTASDLRGRPGSRTSAVSRPPALRMDVARRPTVLTPSDSCRGMRGIRPPHHAGAWTTLTRRKLAEMTGSPRVSLLATMVA
jgi:hypothetical protein